MVVLWLSIIPSKQEVKDSNSFVNIFFSQFSTGPKPYVALPLGVGAFPHGMDLSVWVFSYYQHSRVMSLKICYL